MSSVPVRIVVTGAESTGKTTLTRHVAHKLGTPYSPESARHYLDARLSVDPSFELSAQDVLPIAYAGRATELWLESKGSQLLICDTDVLSTIIYAREIYGFQSNELEILLRNRPATLYLLMDTDIDWTPDAAPGQRTSAESRERFHTLFRRELESRNLPFTLISSSGNPRERKAKALEVVQSVLNTMP